MSENESIVTVRAFLEAMGRGRREDLREAYDRFLADDCVYENTGLPTFRTKAETMAFFFSDMTPDKGIVSIGVDLHHIAAAGDVVFTERTDHHYDASGADILTPKICGVFEVAGGKFKRWADYFDPGPMLHLFETKPLVGEDV
ncbi:MAG: limonene-1,2-epoxide hydrolase family protein [Pseudomonadota bacterium]